MKELLAGLVVGLLFAYPAVAQKKTHRERDGLIGPVRTVVMKKAQLTNKFGQWVEGALMEIATNTYDPMGNVLETIKEQMSYPLSSVKGSEADKTYRTSPSKSRFVSTYDNRGNQIEVIMYDENGSVAAKIAYTYDDKGNVTKQDSYFDASFSERTVCTYDDKGRETEQAHYDADGLLSSKWINVYDAKGNKTEWARYNADGSLAEKTVYTYDDKGNKIAEVKYNANGSLSEKSTYVYDDKGNCIEGAAFEANGSLKSRAISSYDTNGNRVSWIAYNPDGSIKYKEAYEYEYDSFGNWIKKTSSRWVTKFGKSYFEPFQVEYRSITYYPETKKP